MDETSRHVERRELMVREQLEARGISDVGVLSAMRAVPRHLFAPVGFVDAAYRDAPIPLGPQQTISQPYIVALMLQLLALGRNDRVLEIGAGSGYQTALLAELVGEVFAIELDSVLTERAQRLLAEQKYSNVQLRCGDGRLGWPEHAPFDVIVVAAASEEVPRELVRQLAPGGRMILPVGDREEQELVFLSKTEDGLESEFFGGVRFVPMR